MFEFYFQSGEFLGSDTSFLKDLIVEILGAFVGSGTAVYLFFRQNNISKKNELKNKKEFETQKLVYLKTLITKAISLTEKQVENIVDFKKEIDFDPFEIPLLKISSNKEISIIANTLNREEYFHAYFNQFGSYEVQDIFHAFDVIDEKRKLVLESLSKSKSNDYERKNQNLYFLKQVRDELNRLLILMKNESKETTEDYIFLNRILINYEESQRNDANNLFQFRNIVYDPILKYLTDSKKYLLLEYNHLTYSTSQANKSLTPIILSNQKLGRDLTEDGESLKNIIQDLNAKIDKLLNI